jgi:hypothetical protein
VDKEKKKLSDTFWEKADATDALKSAKRKLTQLPELRLRGIELRTPCRQDTRQR